MQPVQSLQLAAPSFLFAALKKKQLRAQLEVLVASNDFEGITKMKRQIEMVQDVATPEDVAVEMEAVT